MSRFFLGFCIVMFGAYATSAQSSSDLAPASPPGKQASASTVDPVQVEARQDLDHGKNAEAIALLEKLAAAKPEAKSVQHDLGLACYRTGKLVEARHAFERAIAQDAADLESVQMLGLTLYRLGQPAAAIPYLQRVRDWSPNANADASHVLGLCFLNSGKLDDARHAFAAEYTLPPDGGQAYLILGKMLMTANLPEQGAEAAQKALSLTSSLPLAHFLIGEVALFKSDVEHAITEFEAERAINPGYAPVYERLGDAYLRISKYDEAEQSLLQALALDTSSTGPFILMGKVLLRKGDAGNAAMYLKHAAKMDPSSYIAHTLLGQAYRSLGQEAEAKQEFAAAQSIHAAGQLKLQPVQ